MALDQPLVETINLSFTHLGKSQPTIENVNFTIYPGEIVLIAGATGSGKSTLMNCLAGIAPTYTGGKLHGKIFYKGINLDDFSVRQRSQYFSILLQNVETQIFTERVWEEFVFGLENWNLPAKEIPIITDAALREFGLEEQKNWLIKQLSAGQKQRLLLSCLLALNQSVMLLDEPLAYLDNKGVKQLLELLKLKSNQGQSVILVEHRLDLVAEICHRTYYFHQGKLSPTPPPISLTSPTPPTPPTSASLLTLKSNNLSWGGYQQFPDLEIAATETILLKGDNGCGKTTLLKLLSGLLKPSTGRIEILGKDISKRSVTEISKNVGFVLQNPNHQLFADSVEREILQPGVEKELAQSILQEINLSDRANDHPQALSQGQKRRLALGAVLARQPKICLLDEIMVGQDPYSLSLMINILKKFTNQGGVLIITSHIPLASQEFPMRIVEL